MAEAEPNLAKRDRILLERLYAFQACHKVKAGPLQQYDGFDLLITYLRGHTETNDRELCRLIHQLRLMAVTIGTSLHNIRDSWYCVVPCADYNECPFADCTKCKNHLNPDECAPDMEWLFQTESRLVHQLIKQIKFEPIRHAGPKAITRVLTGLSNSRMLLFSATCTYGPGFFWAVHNNLLRQKCWVVIGAGRCLGNTVGGHPKQVCCQ